jgi:hypothetical protein
LRWREALSFDGIVSRQDVRSLCLIPHQEYLADVVSNTVKELQELNTPMRVETVDDDLPHASNITLVSVLLLWDLVKDICVRLPN